MAEISMKSTTLTRLSAIVLLSTVAANVKVWLPDQQPQLLSRPTRTLQTKIGPVVESGWSSWSSPANCSRPCGGGVTHQTRHCLLPRGDRALEVCQGAVKKYSSCNTQPCPEGSVDFRQQQCSQFDTQPFENRFYKWVPYVRGESSCELNCRPQGERFYYRQRDRVADGTGCGADNLDMCVDGQCVPVGCDRQLGSPLREDKCRVCGGNGSTCNTVRRSFDKPILKAGYNDILLIPKGATNIVVEETIPTNNYVAIRSVSGHYYVNGNWRIDFPSTVPMAGTHFHYDRKPTDFIAPESFRALGPTNESLYVVLLYQEENKGIKYEYSMPLDTSSPSQTQYVWKFEPWSECSQPCGSGEQRRGVLCVASDTSESVSEELCDSAAKPSDWQLCELKSCDAKWTVSEWSACVAVSAGQCVRHRRLVCRRRVAADRYETLADDECRRQMAPPPPDTVAVCQSNEPSCPRLYVGPWSPCDRLCGAGRQKRELICHSHSANGSVQTLSLEQCRVDPLPSSTRSCQLRPCQGTDWLVSPWHSCENKCGLSLRHRQVICADIEGKTYPDSMCRSRPRPESTSTCSSPERCTYRWYASQWSECSAQCGVGVRTRSVFCGTSSQFRCTAAAAPAAAPAAAAAAAEEAVTAVADTMCSAVDKYHTVENCSTDGGECSPVWMTGPWGKCSRECGGGVQTRRLFCIDGATARPHENCSRNDVPLTIQDCNRHSCQQHGLQGKTREQSHFCISNDGTKIELRKSVLGVNLTKDETGDTTTDSQSVTTETAAPPATEPAPEDSSSSHVTASTQFATATLVSELEEEAASGDGSGDYAGSGYDAIELMELVESTEIYLSGGDQDIGERVSLSGVTPADVESNDHSPTDSVLQESVNSPSTVTDQTIATSLAPETDPSLSQTQTTVSTRAETDSPVFSTVDSTTHSSVGDTSTAGYAYSESVRAEDDTVLVTEPQTVTEPVSHSPPSSQLATSTDHSTSPDSSSATITTTTTTTTLASGLVTSTAHDSSTIMELSDMIQSSEADLTAVTTSVPTSDTTTNAYELSEATGQLVSTLATWLDGATTIVSDTLSSLYSSTATVSVSEELSDSDMDELSSHSTPLYSSTEMSTVVQWTEAEGEMDESSIFSEISGDESSGEMSGDGIVEHEVSGDNYETYATDDGVLYEESSKFTEEISGHLPIKIEELLNNEDSGISGDELWTTSGVDGFISERIRTRRSPASRLPRNTVDVDVLPNTGLDKLSEHIEPIKSGIPVTTDHRLSAGVDDNQLTNVDDNKEMDGSAEEYERDVTEYAMKADEIQEDMFGMEDTDISGEEMGSGLLDDDIEKSTDAVPALPVCRQEQLDCAVSKYGCCADGLTRAQGPFLANCPQVTGCHKTRHGCCPDLVTPATGEDLTDCPPALNCSQLLFGCCDSINNNNNSSGSSSAGIARSRPPGTPGDDPACSGANHTCNYTRYGCCADGETVADGPLDQGCDRHVTTTESTVSTTTPPLPPPSPPPSSSDTTVNISDSSEQTPTEIGDQCNYTSAVFGCCDNSSYPAHAQHQLGCCALTEFGCCSDHITPATSTNKSECHCSTARFGCCADNVTAARGPDLFACSCLLSEHGCCDDGVTLAHGPDHEGCECEQSQFGCCPDGRTPATANSSHSSCGCEASQFGCCLDGVVPAQGVDFQGCPEKPFDRSKFCALPKKRGSCRDYSVRWYFDMEYGGCSQFWYSGCHGNENSFVTHQECSDKCTLPSSPSDFCKLPVTKGACDGNYPSWYYNYERSKCERFVYGGCLGNANRFDTEENCYKHCFADSKTDACQQSVQRGPCRGNVTRWFFNRSASVCQPFVYGGCLANGNNFLTQTECQQRCARPERTAAAAVCRLPVAAGGCSETLARWHYDSARKMCAPFYYSGCGGNGNRFTSERQCRSVCPASYSSDEGGAICHLPPDSGPCTNSSEHFHFDAVSQRCRQFDYGACLGNANRFTSVDECLAQCGTNVSESVQSVLEANADSRADSTTAADGGTVTTTESPDPRVCELTNDAGPCQVATPAWFFSSAHSRCEPFVYGGCGGNGNKFVSREQCQRVCGGQRHQDVCSVAPAAGGCNGSQIKWYFDFRDARCRAFSYSGCAGNGNRFSSELECQSLCVHMRELEFTPVQTVEPTTASAPSLPGVEPTAAVSDDSQPLQPDHCAKEHMDCSNIRCPLGVERHATEAGCQHCSCYNPCRQVACQSAAMRCVVQYRSLNDSSRLAYSTICRQKVKAGACGGDGGGGGGDGGAPDGGPLGACHTAWTECRDDADCPHQLKCCHDGCTMRCLPAQPSVSSPTTLSTLDPPTTTVPSPPTAATSSVVQSTESTAVETESHDTQHQLIYGKRRTVIPARILAIESDKSAAEGTLVSFKCLAEGEPTPTVLWYHGDQLIDTGRGRYKQESGGSLTIVGVVREDAGQLACVVNNSAASHDRRTVTLTVTAGKPRPSAILPVAGDQQPVTSLGQAAILRCHAYGWPRPHVTWWRGQLLLSPGAASSAGGGGGWHHRYRSRDRALHVLAVRLRDLGVYTCQAYNGLGRAVVSSVTLRAYSPLARPGADSLDATAAPVEDYSQQLASAPGAREYLKFLLPPKRTHTTASAAAVLPSVSGGVAQGTHTENASRKTAAAAATVNATIVLDQHKFAANSDIRVPCHVTSAGDAPPLVTWYRDGLPLDTSDRVKPFGAALLILRSRPSDSANYTCQAANGRSQSSSSVHITVASPDTSASCVDNPYFANCRLIVRAHYCHNPYYGRFCCRSCRAANQLQSPGHPATRQPTDSASIRRQSSAVVRKTARSTALNSNNNNNTLGTQS